MYIPLHNWLQKVQQLPERTAISTRLFGHYVFRNKTKEVPSIFHLILLLFDTDSPLPACKH